MRLDLAIPGAILPRRAEQHLSGWPGLRIERDRVGRRAVGTLEVSEFDEDVPHETGIAIRNREMSLAAPDCKPGREIGRPGTRGVHGRAGGDEAAIDQPNSLRRDRRSGRPHDWRAA